MENLLSANPSKSIENNLYKLPISTFPEILIIISSKRSDKKKSKNILTLELALLDLHKAVFCRMPLEGFDDSSLFANALREFIVYWLEHASSANISQKAAIVEIFSHNFYFEGRAKVPKFHAQEEMLKYNETLLQFLFNLCAPIPEEPPGKVEEAEKKLHKLIFSALINFIKHSFALPTLLNTLVNFVADSLEHRQPWEIKESSIECLYLLLNRTKNELDTFITRSLDTNNKSSSSFFLAISMNVSRNTQEWLSIFPIEKM